MKRDYQSERLNNAINLLKSRQELELRLLKEQFYITYEGLKPISIFKNIFSEITSSPDIKDNILNNVIGLTTGYISKKVVFGSSHNPLKKLLGTILQFAISNAVVKNSESIKAIGENIFSGLFGNLSTSKKNFSENDA